MSPIVLLMLASLGQLPLSADVRPMPVRGAVVDASGNAVANADVWLADAPSTIEGLRPRLELAWLGRMPISAGASPVLVQGRADESGRFVLELPAEAVARRPPPALAVWAASKEKDGRWRIGVRRLPRIVLADDEPVRIEIGITDKCELIINGADGKPYENARVAPVRAFGLPVPGPLARMLAATTDAQGHAVIGGLEREAINGVRVERAAYGTQTIQDFKFKIQGSRGPLTLALAPVGRVEGRLTFPQGDRAPVRGVKVRATSYVGGHEGSGRTGEAIVDCDAEGRFTIPAIAAGALALKLEYDREHGTSARAWPIGEVVVRAGQTTRLPVPMRQVVKARGIVREAGDAQRPIAGAVLDHSTFYGRSTAVTTDGAGWFQAFPWREEITLEMEPVMVPVPYYVPAGWSAGYRDLPPRGENEQTMPPIEIPRGVDVRGTVIGEAGKPVAGVWIDARSAARADPAERARSDRSGAFVLHGVDPHAELIVNAWNGVAASGDVALGAETLAKGPIVMPLAVDRVAPITGKVVDANGQPIAGAIVHIEGWHRTSRNTDQDEFLNRFPVEETPGPHKTDAEGRYRTRGRFPAHCAYGIIVEAPGRPMVRSPLIVIGDPARPMPPVVAPRLRAVVGIVVDRQGRPIAGARVFQSGDGPMPTETLSGQDGTFHLPGFLEGPALVFARKDGFRRAFTTCAPDGQAARIVLTSNNEPPAVACGTLPPALSRAEENALSARLIGRVYDRAARETKSRAAFVLLLMVSQFDPYGVLDRLEGVQALTVDQRGLARRYVARGLAQRQGADDADADDRLDDALAIIEALPAPDLRAWGQMESLDARPDLPADRKLALIDSALLNIGAIRDAKLRIYYFEQIAGRLIELNEMDRARAAVEEGRALTQGAFADKEQTYWLARLAGVELRTSPNVSAALARFDALRLKEMGGKETVRAFGLDTCYGEAALHYAARDPALAETLAGRMSFILPRRANQTVLAVCERMAPADHERARRLIERITEDERVLFPYGLGLMARAIAAKDRATARRWLEEAYTELEHLRARGWFSQFASICGVAGALLPVAEAIDVSNLSEYLARALALRPGTSGRGPSGWIPERAAALAAMVARYDRGLAAQILRRDLDEVVTRRQAAGTAVVLDGQAVLSALALIDPRQAVASAETIAGRPMVAPFPWYSNGAISIAEILAYHGERRWRAVAEETLSLWTPAQGLR